MLYGPPTLTYQATGASLITLCPDTVIAPDMAGLQGCPGYLGWSTG